MSTGAKVNPRICGFAPWSIQAEVPEIQNEVLEGPPLRDGDTIQGPVRGSDGDFLVSMLLKASI